MSTQAVQAHNTARLQAPGGARPSLTWSSSLASRAQSWANHLAEIGRMDHDDTPDGENIYSSGGGSPSFSDAVGAWVAERPQYHGEEIGDPNLDFNAVGHYTQVVWPETTQVGMGMARAGDGAVYIVGRYSPAGNMSGLSAWRAGQSGPSPSPSPPKTQDVYFLVNSSKNGQTSSGIAYYNVMGGNDGKQPDKYVDIKKGGHVVWEGATHTATFADGTRVSATVAPDAEVKKAALYSKVGSANIGGKGHGLYKDRIRVLYRVDGWEVSCIYYG